MPAADAPFAPFSVSAQMLRDSVVQIARNQLGTKYKRGGQSPDRGFHCSGPVPYVMSLFNFEVPRTARQQAGVGLTVVKDTLHLLPGDLLTFGKGTKGVVSHIGIYAGNGRYIHASSVAGRVIESPLDRPPSALIKAFKSARRVFGGDTVLITTLATKH